MPSPDGKHRFWLKLFTSIHDRLALEMNGFQQEAHVLEWMIKGKIILKRNTPNNYRSITCIPMMWEILTALIR